MGTVYDWLRDENFVAALEEQKAHEISACLNDLRRASREGNVTAAIYKLKILDPEQYDDQRYRDKKKNEHDLDMLEAKKKEIEEVFENLPQIIYREVDGSSDSKPE